MLIINGKLQKNIHSSNHNFFTENFRVILTIMKYDINRLIQYVVLFAVDQCVKFEIYLTWNKRSQFIIKD